MEPRNPVVSRGYPGIPVGFVDIDPIADEGSTVEGDDTPHPVPYLIMPCTRCWPWYAEVVVHGDPPRTWVREWHAVDCSGWGHLLTTPATVENDSKHLQSIFTPGGPG